VAFVFGEKNTTKNSIHIFSFFYNCYYNTLLVKTRQRRLIEAAIDVMLPTAANILL
jgi:hypothetical protein